MVCVDYGYLYNIKRSNMKKDHWDNIYATKSMQEVSWYQEIPITSLDLIFKLALPRDASIIDIGGGDSFLVDELLKLGYTNISVLDISSNAIEKAKERLGDLAINVTWIVSDITEFIPSKKYDVWHDRAAFHFLTKLEDIEIYKQLVKNNVKENAHFILATFSDEGLDKCSGLFVSKYSEQQQKLTFEQTFDLVNSFKYSHLTPFGRIQDFVFSLFKKKYM